MAEIGPQIGPAAPPARPVPPSGRPAPKIGGGRLGPGPPPVHQRMGRRSMSVAGDAVMMAAAAAAAAGNRSILSSAVVGRKLRQDATDEKPPSRDSGAAAESPTSQLPGTPADVPEVTGATSDNPEPIAAGGAFVRKGDARGIAADEQQQQEGGSVADHLMECRPLFVPMKSNAQGMVEGHEMEPTVIIKTSFISKLEGQEENMEALKGATSGVNLAKFVQDHRALMLDFFRYEFRKNEDLPAFRRALGLPWYTQLPLALLLLLVLSGTLLLFWIRFEVSLAEDGVEALKVPPPIKPDFSEQVLSVQLDRHFVTPGKQSRSCRCVDWPHDPRVRYHATDVQPVEQNAYMRFHSMMNRTMIHSIELYTEPYSAVANGVSYCARPGVRRNHECEYLPDGASTLQLLWQWSPDAESRGYAAQAEIPAFAGFPMGGAETGSLLLAVNYDASGFPAPITSTPFSFWDESGVSIQLTTMLQEHSLARLTMANFDFQSGPGSNKATHCFALSTRSLNFGGADETNLTAAALQRNGEVSALGWTMRTRQWGTKVRLTAWRPAVNVIPYGGQATTTPDVDISVPNWRDEFAARYGNGSAFSGASGRERDPDHLRWQMLWSQSDTSFRPGEVRTYPLTSTDVGESGNVVTGQPAGDHCSCHSDAHVDAETGRCMSSKGQLLVDCGSTLQHGDVICSRCEFNESYTLNSGLDADDELCLAHLLVYPAEAVAQTRYTTLETCRGGFHNADTTALGCVDTDECASSPCADDVMCNESTTVPASAGKFVPIGMGHRACRFTSEDDNSRDYYTFVEVDAFDRAACQSLCEALDGDTCRGFEYRSSTGACELWNVSPAFSAVADGRECFARVGSIGTYACGVR